MQKFLDPDVGEASTATAVALGRKLPTLERTIPPKQVTLTVLNGNGVAGSAGNASYLLGQKGYVTVTPPNGQPANAPNWNYFHSKVYFDPARAADGKIAAPAGRQATRERRRRADARQDQAALERGAGDRGSSARPSTVSSRRS